MATATTYPSNAAGSGWVAVSNATGNSPATYAVLPSGMLPPSRLYVYNFDNIDSGNAYAEGANFSDPKAVIQNIECLVTVIASGTPGSAQKLNVFMTLDGSTKYTSGSILCSNNIVSQEYTLRFYWSPAGRKFYRREIRNNSAFGVFLELPTAGSGAIGVSRVKLILNYTYDGYLQGERSTFPKVNDSITHVVNSPNRAVEDETYVIRSEQQNRLGDAIIAVERACLGDSYVLGGLGPGVFHIGQQGAVGSYPEIYLLNCVVTGVLLNRLVNKTLYVHGTSTLINQARINNYLGQVNRISRFPSLPSADTSVQWLDAYHVTGTGFVAVSGTYWPVHISPEVMLFTTGGTGSTLQVGYNVGFTTLPGPITQYTYYGGNERRLPDIKSYMPSSSDLYFTSWPFQIRITAIGVPRDYS